MGDKKEHSEIVDKFCCIPYWVIAVPTILLTQLLYFILTVAPETLQTYITRDLNLTNAQYSALASIAGWSSLFDILHGIIIERWWGLKKATIIYLLFTVTGSIIFIVAGFLKSYPLMITGRFVFGAGSSPLTLCMSGYSVHWFGESRMFNVMVGMSNSITWLGFTVALLISVPLYEYLDTIQKLKDYSLGITLGSIIFVSMCLISLSSILLTCMYRKKEEPSLKQDVEQMKNVNEMETKQSKLLVKFSLKFWILSLSTFIYVAAVTNFMTMAQGFFNQIYHEPASKANHLSSIYTVVQCGLSPVIGVLNDRFGRNHSFFVLAIGGAILAHGLFYFCHINPIIPTLILGISSGFSTSLWALYMYTSDKDQRIIAYGVAKTGSCGSLAIASFVSGYIVDDFGYLGLELFYFILSASIVPLDILLWYLDFRNDSSLNLTPLQLKERNEKGNLQEKDVQVNKSGSTTTSTVSDKSEE